MKALELKGIIGKIPDDDEIIFMTGIESHDRIAYIAKGVKVGEEEKDAGAVELPENNWLLFLI